MELKLPFSSHSNKARIAFNRTLWNWNSLRTLWERYSETLLIVPYGIETCFMSIRIHDFLAFNRTLWNWNYITTGVPSSASWLLIVPYGIETLHVQNIFHFHSLLIVPYGIETIFHIYSLYFIALLIVPYGIETSICL